MGLIRLLSNSMVWINKYHISLIIFFNNCIGLKYAQQRKVIAELALSRQDFEEVLLAKDKELEVTKVCFCWT